MLGARGFDASVTALGPMSSRKAGCTVRIDLGAPRA